MGARRVRPEASAVVRSRLWQPVVPEGIGSCKSAGPLAQWQRAVPREAGAAAVEECLGHPAATPRRLVAPADVATYEEAYPLLPWDEQRYRFERILMPNLQAGGRIEIFLDTQTGMHVVAKRFPQQRLCGSPEAYRAANPGELQDPWREIALTQLLGSRGSMSNGTTRGVCACHGAFTDAQGDALLITEYVPGGDLFDVAGQLGSPGPEREEQAWPLIRSFLRAVTNLHDLGIAHGDISLENALRRPGMCGEVVLIDFEAAVTGDRDLSAASGSRGKPSYQAPEMHVREHYDARAADLFSCGVAIYGLAVGTYPWSSTRPGVCKSFGFFAARGLEAFLERKCVGGRPVGEVMSGKLCALLAVLLDFEPACRDAFKQFLEGDGEVHAEVPETLVGA
mmetsp:Transcript_69542/g.225009  ORF Transcript_69542/g.225009 Transcript_69542/m.225009 type:complete len:395 (+) Transcript_69542:72-1256(+)